MGSMGEQETPKTVNCNNHEEVTSPRGRGEARGISQERSTSWAHRGTVEAGIMR